MRPSILAGGFFALTQTIPRWRSALWRRWYDTLARKDRAGDLLFMNYGYDEGVSSVELSPDDEPFRYGIQLYARGTRGLRLAGKDLLEVGSGRGGGGSYFIRYCDPRSYTGVDLSGEAVRRCQRELALTRSRWIEGRANRLPVPDATVDVLVNVESSHSYPSMPDFFREVRRVLRPGGHMALADLRKVEQIAELQEQAARSGLLMIEQSVITREVIRVLDGITRRREAQIQSDVPALLRPAFRDFAGVRDSVLYKMLLHDRLRYFCWRLQRPA